ncbi:DUF3800 domain-containing protein [Campylobacter sp.]|uniref:DUF3800 domain-containing protein n=1 Tax=Campylobacter sp. TaxID=205 RepID=UPI002AA6FCE6|nr:DUF3800 domain-containing protein [Campylobacter sp.]MCI6564403.1 hypothetical protein [Campylobacter sp.]MCI6579504.1 hypothetical protein [Campylobacter sp.]MCI7015020.1 hypothetical protein [Campylobacter sp.]
MIDFPTSNIKINLYYDETNNIRKFYLTNNKREYLNSDISAFILGGVGLKPEMLSKNNVFDKSLKDLFEKLGLQKTQSELKFKHIAHGSFQDILKSKKLNILFDFLLENNIVLHMQILDVIHWSLIDIIESQTTMDIVKPYFFLDVCILNKVKSALTEIAKSFKTDFFKNLYDFKYPDVIDKKKKFVIFLKKFLLKFNEEKLYVKKGIDPVILELLEKVLCKIEEFDNDMFVFLENEPEHELIDKFLEFYFYRIISFPQCYHIFDNEFEVKKKLSNFLKEKNNYKFVDSKDNLLVQLSDIMVGFFRSLFEYILKIDYIDIEDVFNSFSKEEKICLKKFFNLYQKTEEIDTKLFQYITSIFDINKIHKLAELSLNSKS